MEYSFWGRAKNIAQERCLSLLHSACDAGDHPRQCILQERKLPMSSELQHADHPQLEALRWIGGTDGYLRLIDQTLLPTELRYVECHQVETLWEAIRMLRIRGAPAIGIAAAYGLCLAVRGAVKAGEQAFFERLEQAANYLASSRPTAVNLFWALERIKQKARRLRGRCEVGEIFAQLLAEAVAIHEEDRQMCEQIGLHGASLLQDGWSVLTHCNTGALATGGIGTALGVIIAAVASGKRLHVFADETRPLLQGARLTAWELLQRKIPVTVVCDNMAGVLMQSGRVQAVITGADRICANGEVANKIGTYSLAVLAARHNVPFYVAAPSSTFDLRLLSGQQIPIEQRDRREVTHWGGRQIAPDGVEVFNPAFDVTPAELITALICEKGVIRPVTRQRIAEVLGG